MIKKQRNQKNPCGVYLFLHVCMYVHIHIVSGLSVAQRECIHAVIALPFCGSLLAFDILLTSVLKH